MMHLSSIPHRLIFVRDFPKLKLLGILVDKLIEEKFPAFAEAMKERQMNSILFTPQWFMGCFLSAGFDQDLSSFIFDQFLAYGICPLVAFGIAMIELHMDIFLREGFEQTLNLLSRPGNSPAMASHQRINVTWNRNWMNSSEYDRRLKEALEIQKAQTK